LLREVVGLAPVIAFHGHDGALGQGERRNGQPTDMCPDLDRVGQDRVSPVGLAVQEIGDPLEEQGRRAPPACWGQAGHGDFGVGSHPAHAVAAQQGPGQRHPAFGGAAIGKRHHPCAMLGGRHPTLGARRFAQQRLDKGPEHGDLQMTFDNSPVLKPLEPVADGVDPPPRIGRNRHGGDQPGGPVGVAGGLGMVDGQLRQPVGLAPGGRPDVQLRDQLGRSSVRSDPLASRTASHSGPHMRSSTAVRVMNDTNSGAKCVSSSERR
jgi:hypothetical protein